MTVQGLRMFNPKATVANNVPTVNHDISDEVWVICFHCVHLMGVGSIVHITYSFYNYFMLAYVISLVIII